MKKFLLAFFLFSFVTSGFSQSNCDSIASRYPYHFFGTIPDTKPLEVLINELVEYTGCTIDTIIPKTKDTLFYFRGFSTSFNPFGGAAGKVEYQIRESQPKKGTGHEHRKQNIPLTMEVILLGEGSKESYKQLLTIFNQLRSDFKECLSESPTTSLKKKDLRKFSLFTPFRINRAIAKNKFPIPERMNLPYLNFVLSLGKYYQDKASWCLSIRFLFSSFIIMD
ncbi:MAG TPA: hypothetical protein PK275_05955 [Chitinophagaceae bacterium]|nr:hypothetical protein [Chitinophagaceae bacterium]